ncbi:MAG: alanine racemase [Gemmatimonadetes bacterium]|nr:alanine racemase [Gemmatimonadota bacterium]
MRTWADIRFEALAANLAALRQLLPARAGLLLPVKANAYGHGAVPIARWAEELGVSWLGVATVDEGVELRAAGVAARVLLFGPLPLARVGEVAHSRITPTLCSVEEAARWARVAPGVPAHVEVDTGMGRAGFDWRSRCVDRLARLSGISIEGVYSHFPAADSDIEFTAEQRRRFGEVLERLAREGVRPALTHLANSAAVLGGCPDTCELARPGIAAYGSCASFREALREQDRGRGRGTTSLRPVLQWWARIVQLRDFAAGDSVGYGRTVRLDRPTRAALLAVGYGDGYPRSQAAEGFVEIRGRRCRILGRISMDLTLVDATPAPEVRMGEDALLLGEAPGLSADDLAGRSGTIGYEILTAIRARVERRYLRGPEARMAAPEPVGEAEAQAR